MANRLKFIGSGLFNILPLMLFIVGCVWVLLFPAISVTTGELKPRGMYVDEHALLVHSQLFKNPVLEPVDYTNATHTLSMCDKLDNDLISCSTFKYLPSVGMEHVTDITQVILRPYRSKIIHQSTVLVFYYIAGVECLEGLVMQLINSIQQHLHRAEWMARNVVILAVPSQNPSLSDAWLRQTHIPSTQQLQDLACALVDGSVGGYVGTIREAYVLDLAEENACHSNSSHYAFSSITLLHDGLNGVLPNMDMVSYPLAIHSTGVLRTHSEVCSAQLSSVISATLARLQEAYPHHDAMNMLAFVAAGLWAELSSTPALHLYRRRLLGLACSIHAQIFPVLPSVHAEFLKYNIDAITLRPVALSAEKGLQQQQKKKVSRSRGPPKRQQQVLGPEKLLEVLVSFLYISNNLHEELHHSHFYYLLLGSDSFVGINEYGFTAAMFLLALLALFHQLCGRCGEDHYLIALYCVTTATLPILVALSALSEPSSTSLEMSSIWSLLQQVTSVLLIDAPEGWLASAVLALAYAAGLGTLLLWNLGYRSPSAGEEADRLCDVQQCDVAVASCLASPVVLFPTLCVLVLAILLCLSWLFAQNFSLAVVLAVSVLPTLLLGSLAVRRRGDGTRVTVRRLGLAGILTLSAALHSPPGIYALDCGLATVWSASGPGRSVLLDALLQAWCQKAVHAFPASLLLHTLTSYYCASCALLMLC